MATLCGLICFISLWNSYSYCSRPSGSLTDFLYYFATYICILEYFHVAWDIIYHGLLIILWISIGFLIIRSLWISISLLIFRSLWISISLVWLLRCSYPVGARFIFWRIYILEHYKFRVSNRQGKLFANLQKYVPLKTCWAPFLIKQQLSYNILWFQTFHSNYIQVFTYLGAV